LWAVLTRAVAVVGTVVVSWRRWATKVDPEASPVDLLLLKHDLGLLSILSRDEVCVCETSWLATSSINGNPDVQNVLALAEQIAEVFVGHLERQVADKQSLAWWVQWL